MGEKKLDIFNSHDLICFPYDGAEPCPLDVVEDSFEVESEGVIVCRPSNETFSLGCSISNFPLIDILKGVQASDEIKTVVIYADVRIKRPKNLKYPNKKRARRVWNKWRKRYGVDGGHGLVIPKAKVDVSFDGETANVFIHAQDCHKEG